MPPSSAGSALGFTGQTAVPANKENNGSKKAGHEATLIGQGGSSLGGNSNSNLGANSHLASGSA